MNASPRISRGDAKRYVKSVHGRVVVIQVTEVPVPVIRPAIVPALTWIGLVPQRPVTSARQVVLVGPAVDCAVAGRERAGLGMQPGPGFVGHLGEQMVDLLRAAP